MSMFYPTLPSNEHAKKIVELYGSINREQAEIPGTIKFVFLCYTNRCGSNYVAETIASTGKFNLAGEDLNYDTVTNHTKKHGFKSFQKYFTFLLNIKSRSGFLFLKVAPAHIEVLGRSGILDQIADFSAFLLIERADKLAQAISFAIAIGTNKYTSAQVGTRAPAEVEFDPQKISGILNGIADSYKQFDLFFGRNGIIPELLVYEEFAANPVGMLESVGQRLGIAQLTAMPEHVRIARQADETNRIWRRQYLATDRV